MLFKCKPFSHLQDVEVHIRTQRIVDASGKEIATKEYWTIKGAVRRDEKQPQEGDKQ